MVMPVHTALPFVRDGRLQAIGVTTQARSPFMPDQAKRWLEKPRALDMRFIDPEAMLAPEPQPRAEQMIWFQGDYVKELIAATDYPTFDIEGVNKTFMVWEHHKMDDIMGFRNNAYASLMTGTMSPKHHTPWKDALDDSLEAYLAVK